MPKETTIEAAIPRLYKRPALNLLMFGYVRGAREVLHTVTVKQAISDFMDLFDLDHDQYNIDSALVTFHRMQRELFDILKND